MFESFRKKRVPVRIVLYVLGICGFAGCEASTTVSGNVTYEGEPVASGWITFLPSGGQGTEAGAEIVNGSYTVEQIEPGEKTVQIIGVQEVPYVASSEEMERASRERPEVVEQTDLVHQADNVPANATGNNARVVIRKGDQTQDFHLTKPKN